MFVCLSVHLSIRLSVCLSVRLSVCLSVCPSICSSVCLSVCTFVCLSVHLSVHLSIRLSVCPSVCLSVCPSIRSSVCLSVCTFVCLSVHLSVHAHIAHNALDAGCDALPFEIEAVVVKTYKHFFIYTVRCETLKKMCDEADVIYKNLTKHSGTRFLSLHPATKTMISMFSPLKDFFQHSDVCPVVIKKFFEDKCSFFWLLFLENQLKTGNEAILKMETTAGSCFEIARETKLLLEKFQNRKFLNFIPREAKEKNAEI
jgi:hypothetical protein